MVKRERGKARKWNNIHILSRLNFNWQPSPNHPLFQGSHQIETLCCHLPVCNGQMQCGFAFCTLGIGVILRATDSSQIRNHISRNKIQKPKILTGKVLVFSLSSWSWKSKTSISNDLWRYRDPLTKISFNFVLEKLDRRHQLCWNCNAAGFNPVVVQQQLDCLDLHSGEIATGTSNHLK